MVAFLQKHGAPFDLSDFAEYFARDRGAGADDLPRLHRLQARLRQPGAGAAAGAQHPGELRSARHGHDSADYIHTVIEALKLAYADRDTYYADPAFVQVPGEGLLSKAYAKERAALIDPKRASKAFIAGDPLPLRLARQGVDVLEANVQRWHTIARCAATRLTASLGLDSAGVVKDTTHMAIIDKDGNIFDVTPSGGWMPGAVILGDTGIGMSVRGEQFWLDKTRANQIRPRARPRYTLTPSLVFKGDDADDGARHARRRQPGSDDPAGVPEHRRVLGRLVSQPARGARVAARPDAAFLRVVLAAHGRLQQAQCRGHHF